MDKRNFECTVSKSDHCDVTDLIPLYDGELSQKKFKEQFGNHSRASTSSKQSSRSRNGVIPWNNSAYLPKDNTKNSYLKIFYNRLVHSNKFQNSSSRCLSCPECTPTRNCDNKESPTEVEEQPIINDLQSISCVPTITTITKKLLPPTTSNNNSPASHNNLLLLNPSTTNENPKTKPPSVKLKNNKQIIKCTILTRLGPDLSAQKTKYELFKKRLEYGSKATQRNRIKMNELNKLKKLKSTND